MFLDGIHPDDNRSQMERLGTLKMEEGEGDQDQDYGDEEGLP